jgi:uncharacterized protein (TIGR03435 family)
MKVLVLLAALWSSGTALSQATFAVAVIHPSAAQVQFESDGETKLLPGTLAMRDVSIETCIKWAYGVQRAQVVGPGLLTSEKYDITAKSEGVATKNEMRAMMRSLLTERFGLVFHTEKRELKSYALVVAKGGPKMKQATEDEVPLRTNNAMGSTGRALTMAELADFLGGPVERVVVDKTGLAGRWDFSFDFTKYMVDPPKGIDDYLLVLNETLEGEIGLKMVPEKDVVDVMVVDTVKKASAN